MWCWRDRKEAKDLEKWWETRPGRWWGQRGGDFVLHSEPRGSALLGRGGWDQSQVFTESLCYRFTWGGASGGGEMGRFWIQSFGGKVRI